MRSCRLFTLLLVVTALLTSPGLQAREISSYARVNEDGTLRIDGYRIHLTGIHIPDTGRTCKQYVNPPVCGSRAYIALEFKINGFVRCEILSRNADRSLVGWCRVNATSFDEGEDLSAYLLERGWAVALPDAPFEYQTLEKIARNRGIGIWGFPVDNVIRR
ncbi:nuclease-like protein [Parahaliea maris]|uniref:Nuclease-like protein n=1 Tax=Parahaliea maris TaxID=2716870 RepID=A0A5C9A7J3_9GAMM|nr:nuclease-like protein [Parahaliea maris]TXS95191.1 nuclease-like protein [Parahaliea maris]